MIEVLTVSKHNPIHRLNTVFGAECLLLILPNKLECLCKLVFKFRILHGLLLQHSLMSITIMKEIQQEESEGYKVVVFIIESRRSSMGTLREPEHLSLFRRRCRRLAVELQALVPIGDPQAVRGAVSHHALSVGFRASPADHPDVIAPVAVVEKEHPVVGDPGELPDAGEMRLRLVAVSRHTHHKQR